MLNFAAACFYCCTCVPVPCDAFGNLGLKVKMDCSQFSDDQKGLSAAYGGYTCAAVKEANGCFEQKYKSVVDKYCKKTCVNRANCRPTGAPTASPTMGLAGSRLGTAWCSAHGCCCSAGWHGDSCEDVNECASTPCRNGGTCGDSYTNHTLVNDYDRKCAKPTVINSSTFEQLKHSARCTRRVCCSLRCLILSCCAFQVPL